MFFCFQRNFKKVVLADISAGRYRYVGSTPRSSTPVATSNSGLACATNACEYSANKCSSKCCFAANGWTVKCSSFRCTVYRTQWANLSGHYTATVCFLSLISSPLEFKMDCSKSHSAWPAGFAVAAGKSTLSCNESSSMGIGSLGTSLYMTASRAPR